MSASLTIQRAAADSVILYFGTTIDPKTHARVMDCLDRLQARIGHGIVSLLPSYASLLVQYDPLHWDENTAQLLLEATCREPGTLLADVLSPTLTLPVWYDPSVGWDIERIAQRNGMSDAEVIARHAAGEYRVYAIGFQPGFGYMGRVDAAIATPRLATPRTTIPAGSVALADDQTAVYPSASPGGWNILGRTPLRLFDPYREPAALLSVGMRVRFEPIDRARYLELGGTL